MHDTELASVAVSSRDAVASRRPSIQLEEVEPTTLSASARERLTDELYAVHRRIFAGVSRASFAAYVVGPQAAYSRVQVLRAGADRRAVGYFAYHIYERTIEGRLHAVVRIESGYERKFRGVSVAAPFLGRQLLITCARYPLTPKHYFGCYVHPSAYLAMTRLALLWPNWRRPTPPKTEGLMQTLAEEFGLAPVPRAGPNVVEVGWITKQSAREAEGWARREDPAVQTFARLNPSYAAGHGLLVYASVSLGSVIRGAWMLARRHALRLLG